MPKDAEVVNWGEMIGINICAGACMGTATSAFQYAWLLAPNTKGTNKKILLTEVANTLGKQSLKFAFIGGLFTMGAAICSTVRDKHDCFNFGAGGVAVGMYSGFANHNTRRVHFMVMNSIGYGVLGAFADTVQRSQKRSPEDLTETKLKAGYPVIPMWPEQPLQTTNIDMNNDKH
mmetsp:Transcript_5151/g.5283  ORF Transcript_5151/g.5283 Transcript_5151/m.5283 type:complete len:175 (+) Transcript_5151:117-641(+)